MFPTNPQNALIVDQLAAALAALPNGHVLGYDTMKTLTGRDCRTDGRHLCATARKRAERDTGALFATVRGVGVRRLAATEVPGVGAEARHRVGRTAQRGFDRLTTSRYNELTGEERARIDAERSVLGSIAVLSKTKNVPKLPVGTTTSIVLPETGKQS